MLAALAKNSGVVNTYSALTIFQAEW